MLPSLRWLVPAALLATHCGPPPHGVVGAGIAAHSSATSRLPGAVRSPPDAPFPWQYLYDRNALLTSTTVGAYRVAIAEAGHLLVFDRDQHLVGELLLRSAATCLSAASAADALVGFADGTIERVTIPALVREVVARGPARVEWIGVTPGGSSPIAVFTDATAAEPRYTVRALDSGVDTLVLPASAFLLDAEGQLWLGGNHGHRGGTVQRVQLESGRVTSVQTPMGSGVHGFAQVGDEVWAYGGTTHFFNLAAEITRVWPGEPKLLYGHRANLIEAPVDPKLRPTLPIRQLVARGDQVLVFAANALFESDRTLAQWTSGERLVAPQVRPSVEANELEVRGVDFVGDRLLLTTLGDGLVEHTKGGSVSHALPKQLPLAPYAALTSHDALLLLGAGNEPYVIRQGDGWVPARNLLPPPLPAPGADADPQASRWCATLFFPNPDGSIGVIARRGVSRDGDRCANASNDVVLSGSWQHGRFQEHHRELTILNPEEAFALPDGTPALCTSDDVLWTLEPGGFRRDEGWKAPRRTPTNLGRHGSTWLVLDDGHVRELEVSPSRELRLEQVGDLHGGFDAVRLSEEELLFVDQYGVWLFELKTRRRRLFVAHPAADRIDGIEADERGRVWALGERLYLLEAAGTATPLDLPFARPLPPEHWSSERQLVIGGRQVFVPLVDRGLLVLDADAAAAAATARGRSPNANAAPTR